MIASASGVVEDVELDAVVLRVGGLGLRIHVTPATARACAAGKQLRLLTSFVVRQESLALYGFRTPEERDVFESLQSAKGVGPRTALAALSVLGPAELRRAVEQGDAAALRRIPGVGLKSAQRLLVEIGGKLGPAGPAPSSATGAEVQAALVQLGWSEQAASQAVASVDGADMDASSLLRAALARLGGGRG